MKYIEASDTRDDRGAGLSILGQVCHDAKCTLVNCGEESTIRQTAFCRRKHMIVNLYMYIEAIF